MRYHTARRLLSLSHAALSSLLPSGENGYVAPGHDATAAAQVVGERKMEEELTLIYSRILRLAVCLCALHNLCVQLCAQDQMRESLMHCILSCVCCPAVRVGTLARCLLGWRWHAYRHYGDESITQALACLFTRH